MVSFFFGSLLKTRQAGAQKNKKQIEAHQGLLALLLHLGLALVVSGLALRHLRLLHVLPHLSQTEAEEALVYARQIPMGAVPGPIRGKGTCLLPVCFFPGVVAFRWGWKNHF